MRDTAVVLGTFDGLHKGHQVVLSSAEGYKRAVVITFPVPPAMDENCELLLTAEDKNCRLIEDGFEIETLDFSKVCDMRAEDFLMWIEEKYSPAAICCGFNYRFGHGGRGNTALIEHFCREKGIAVHIVDAVEEDGIRISSSLIRELIKRGEIERANGLLSAPFSLSGEVLHGDSRGRTMGIPTVNFFYPENLVVARHGVYAARCKVDDREYAAVTYIGNRPTYHIDKCVCETNILDFSGDLYGKRVTVSLLSFLREDRKFDSLDELKVQIEQDIEKTKQKNT